MEQAWIAVGGTLFGVILGGGISFWSLKRVQVSRALHEWRIRTFAKFAGSIMELQTALVDRWFAEYRNTSSSDLDSSVYTARSAAQTAYFEVQLLAREEQVSLAAQKALDVTATIKRAPNKDAVQMVVDESNICIKKFIAVARQEIAAEEKI